MKLRILFSLALVLGGSFFAVIQSACGYEMLIQLNHTNLNTDYSFLQVVAVRNHFTNNEEVFFTVVVIPKDKHQPENFTGRLVIRDSQQNPPDDFIAQTSVRARKWPGGPGFESISKSLWSKCIAFQFLVAAKHLEKSEFVIEETPYSMASPTAYCFNLKEFSKP